MSLSPIETALIGATVKKPSIVIPSSPDLQISASPHPFRMERVHVSVMAGLTVAEIIEKVQPDARLRTGAIVMIGGKTVPQGFWHSVRPKHGHLIEVMITLGRGGGGGKSPLRTLLSIAVLAAGAAFGPALGTALVGSGGLSIGGLVISASSIGSGLIGIVGNLLVGQLAPPPKPKMGQLSGTAPTYASSQYFSIESARNRERPWEKIPKVFGRHRLWGDKGAKEYTEIEGDDQYLRGIVVWGYGPLALSDFRLGETAIEEFEGVEIEHRHGYEDDAPLTLFTNDVHEEALAVQLAYSDGWQVRTTEPDIDEISIDISCPQGLVAFDDQGHRLSQTLEFDVQYAPTGTDEWSASGGGKTVEGASFSLPVYNYGRYARVIVNKYSGEISLLDGVLQMAMETVYPPSTPPWAVSLCTMWIQPAWLSGERIIDFTDTRTPGTPSRDHPDEFKVTLEGDDTLTVVGGTLYFGGLTMTEARPSEIRRSLRFPVPRGQYDVRVRRLSSDTNSDKIFDKSYWTRIRSIRNESPIRYQRPLAMTAYRIKATGQLNNVVDVLNCIGHSVVKVWNGDDWSTSAPSSNPGALLRDLLQGNGMSAPVADEEINLESYEACYEDCEENGFTYNSVIDYKTSISEMQDDIASAARAFVHRPDGRYTVKMERVQTLAAQHFTPKNTWSFEGKIKYPKLPHGLRVRFSNENMGWRSDMRTVFVDGYDQNNATKYEDIDLPGITDTDLVWRHGRYHLAVGYNRREIYTFWADFESLNCTRGDMCYLAHDVPEFGIAQGLIRSVLLNDGGTHAIGIDIDETVHMAGDKNYVVRIRLGSNESLLAAVENDDDAAGSRSLLFEEPIPVEDAPAVGNLYMFGVSESECLEVVISHVERGPDLTARIVCLPAAQIIHEADQGDIPDWTSSLPQAISPAIPILRHARSDGSVLIRDTDGSLTNRILVTFERPSELFSGIRSLQARFREAGSASVWVYATADVDQREINLVPVEGGITYEYQCRYLSTDNRNNPWSVLQTHTVIGKEAPPAGVLSFSGQQNGPVVLFRWGKVPDLDIRGYDIRYISAGSGLTGDDLWRNMTPLKLSEGGDELTSAGMPPGVWKVGIKAVDTSGNESLDARFITIDVINPYDIIFEQTFTRRWIGEKIDCIVHDVSGHLVSDDGMLASGDNFDVFDQYRLDAPESFTYRPPSVDIGFNYDQVRVWCNFETHIAPGQSGYVSTSLQIATSRDDDPLGAYQSWTIGTVDARRVGFSLQVDMSGTQGSLVSMSPIVDVEERTERGEIESDADNWVRIDYSRPFVLRPFLEITVDSDTPAFVKRQNESGEGFDVSVYDGTGNRISRPTYYTASGA